MPLIRNIEDPRFLKQLDGLERRDQFIREMATAILPGHSSFASVLTIANRVYDRHCSPKAGLLNGRRFERSRRTALSA
jgi:hypothetical protein